MIGAIPAGIMQGLFPQQGSISPWTLSGQQQQPAEPFVYGQGGRRMTPEDIARQRDMAARQMRSDYSPVQHWTQGLGRVADNVIGALSVREADKATAANQDYSRQIAQSLMNPSGSPSASAPPGAASSSMPGGNLPQLMQVIADPYVDANTKALAQMQLEQQQKVAMKQMEWANREQPEIIQLSRIANDATRPEWERRDAAARVKALNDPEIVIPGLPGGTYIGPRSGVGMAYGQVPADAIPAPGTVVADPRKQGGQSATPAGTF